MSSTEGAINDEDASDVPPATLGVGQVTEDDLTDVVRRQKPRKTAKLNAQRANDRYTRGYLEAGMRLLEQEFLPSQPTTERDDGSFPSFNSLRRQDVITEACAADKALTEGRFRSRWEYMPDYLADLIRYALRSSRWSPHFTLVDHYSSQIGHGSLVALAHRVAYNDLDIVRRNSAAMRFQFVVAAFAARDRDAAEALSSAYTSITHKWEAFYQDVLDTRSLSLRPGISTADVTAILHAAMEGFSLRLLGDPNAPLVNDEREQSLLGTLALAIIASCVDPGDHLSLEELVARQLAGSRPLDGP